MSILREIPVFGKGPHRLTLINTDLMEAESMIKLLADEERTRTPGEFAGLSSCAYYKMPYVQPCDPFHELRRLILRVRENTGLRADFRGIVAIETTEWIGHEKDAYFTVLLKFLYDHRDIWRASLVLCDATAVQLQRFAAACACYLTPRPVELQIFSDRTRLRAMIRECFRNHNVRPEGKALELLADALARPEIKTARSLALIERTVEEAIAMAAKNDVLKADEVLAYICSPWSSLSMMAGKVLICERSMDIESKIV